MSEAPDTDLKQTPLHALHKECGAKLTPFAGYEMPVQFGGILGEHRHTRDAASLFDVSHMGQALLKGEDAAAALETLVPGDITGLEPGRTRYTLLTNEQGGILDDLMVTNRGEDLFLVVNASRKDHDFAHIRESLSGRAELEELDDRALIALQGPAAVEALAALDPACRDMGFMNARDLSLDDIECLVTRSGYTGEDGFEISVPAAQAEALARRLLEMDAVSPAGLGARDSLRLEAGLCLYGSDIDETTTPIEAALAWTVAKRRRKGGEAEGGFPGAEIILSQLAEGVSRKRVGLRPEGKAPARAHTQIVSGDGEPAGEITSGGFGPSVNGPVAMGYLRTDLAKPDTAINLIVRGKSLPGRVVRLPFVKHRYVK